MKLSFFTPPQCMAFVDPITHNLVNAAQLQAGVIYDVFAVVKNEDPVEYQNLQVHVTHSAFGIGLPGGVSYIVQPGLIDVPPAVNPNLPGLATLQFQFMAPPSGHGCLTATIVRNKATLNQNLTVLTAPYGASTISFLVFGNPQADETMLLTLEQRLENGTPVTRTNLWAHQFVVPPELTSSSVPGNSDAINLNIPKGNVAFSIGINVTIPQTATEAHVFFVRGTVNGVEQGSVSLLVKPDLTFIKPAPYVHCGYESPDIVLIDPQGREVPFFGNPITDTVLRPNTNYTMRVTVHNASPTPAANTLVRFWQSLIRTVSGVELGEELDMQSVTVPGNGKIEVISRYPFRSGSLSPDTIHRCAIASVYNSQSSTCPKDYPTFDTVWQAGTIWVPFGQEGAHGATAWRNCDSRLVFIGEPWRFEIVTAAQRVRLGDRILPVNLHVESIRIPHDWQTMPEAAETLQLLGAAGVQTQFPMFLIPKLLNKFKKADLGIEVRAEEAKVEALELVPAAAHSIGGKAVTLPASPARKFNLHGTGEKPMPITITGNLPSDAHEGDMFLVRCQATYPKPDGTPGPTIAFTEALHVMHR